jgi:serine/threonine protein kinase
MENEDRESRPPEDFCDYEIREELGHGGMGVVYKARHKRLNATRVLKVLKPDHCTDENFVRDFKREAQLAAQLSHPNVVTVHNTGECAGFHYIEMEFVDGISVAEAIAEKGKTPVYVALEIVSNICDALKYAHNKDLTYEGTTQHGIIHRDVKPENIMITREGEVKLMDFGIARCAQMMGHTEPGKTPGTPGYMSPEQLEGPPARVDHRTDIYSLGVLLYELLSAKPALFGIPLEELVKTIPKRVVRIVAKAMSYNREDRFESAFKMQLEINKYLKHHRRRDLKKAIKNWAFEPKPDVGVGRRKWIKRGVVGLALTLIACGAFIIVLHFIGRSNAAQYLASLQGKIDHSKERYKFMETYASLSWTDVTNLRIQAQNLFDSWKFKDCVNLCDSGCRLIETHIKDYGDSTWAYYNEVETRIDTTDDEGIKDAVEIFMTVAGNLLQKGNYDSTNVVLDLLEDSLKVLSMTPPTRKPQPTFPSPKPLRTPPSSVPDSGSVVPGPHFGVLEIVCLVNSISRHCEIIVNDHATGKETPDTLELEEGEHEIRLIYRTPGDSLQKTRVVTIRSGETARLTVELGDR